MIILRLSFTHSLTHSLMCVARDEMLNLYWKGTESISVRVQPGPGRTGGYTNVSHSMQQIKKMLFLIVFLGVWGALLAFNPSYELRHQVRLSTSARRRYRLPLGSDTQNTGLAAVNGDQGG